jgi:hypothetical protein
MTETESVRRESAGGAQAKRGRGSREVVEPRDRLAFRGVSLRTDAELERRLDLLALRLGLVEGHKRSGRRGKAARAALLAGLEALEARLGGA